jgi:hypothetical protein
MTWWRLLLLGTGLQAHVLFQDLPAQKVCQGGLPWVREFDVAMPCTETVRIRSLSGLTREHQGEARLWLDNTLLGPLRREFGQGGWESPIPVAFSQGKHSLSIECGAEPFEMAGVVIGSASDEAPRPALQAKAPAPAKAQASEAQGSKPPCPGLTQNEQWYPGKPSRTILLSVVAGRPVKTPLLATLKRGERLRWWFYIHPRQKKDSLEFPPVVVEWLQGQDGTGMLAFSIDTQELLRAEGRTQKDYEGKPLGYDEDKWTPLDLAFCQDGTLRLSLNRGEVHGSFQVHDPEIPLRIQTSEIEFEVKGRNN